MGREKQLTFTLSEETKDGEITETQKNKKNKIVFILHRVEHVIGLVKIFRVSERFYSA